MRIARRRDVHDDGRVHLRRQVERAVIRVLRSRARPRPGSRRCGPRRRPPSAGPSAESASAPGNVTSTGSYRVPGSAVNTSVRVCRPRARPASARGRCRWPRSWSARSTASSPFSSASLLEQRLANGAREVGRPAHARPRAVVARARADAEGHGRAVFQAPAGLGFEVPALDERRAQPVRVVLQVPDRLLLARARLREPGQLRFGQRRGRPRSARRSGERAGRPRRDGAARRPPNWRRWPTLYRRWSRRRCAVRAAMTSRPGRASSRMKRDSGSCRLSE